MFEERKRCKGLCLQLVLLTLFPLLAFAAVPHTVTPNDYWYNHTFDAGASPMPCSSVYEDQTHERQWYMGPDHLNMERAWAITRGDEDAIIAIIDQDCAIWHYDLQGRIYQNQSELNGEPNKDDDGDGLIDNFWGWDYDGDDNKVWRETALSSHHGTNMSGIFGAQTNNEDWWPTYSPEASDSSPHRAGMAGITWDNKIYPIRGLNSSVLPGLSPPFSVRGGNAIKALWHIAKRIDLGDNIRVINMSLRYYAFYGGQNCYAPGDTTNYASDYSQRFHLGYYRMCDAIDACISRGAIVVGGAGNDNGNQSEIGMPCLYDPVLCVSCIDATDERWEMSGSGGNWGASVDVCGYGSTRWNLGADGFHDFEFPYDNPVSLGLAENFLPLAWRFCGQEAYYDTTVIVAPTNMQTSGATAQASGVSALVAGAYPQLSAQQIHNMVKRGCVDVTSLNQNNCNGTCDGLLGSGRLDAYRALTLWGEVARDTVFTGDVWISADVTIGQGVTATFAPGCKIHVAPDNQASGTGGIAFLVHGNLNVAGTQADPVVFSAWCQNRQKKDWDGIYIYADAGTVTLDNLQCRNATYGIYAQKTITVSNAVIDSCYNGIVLEFNDSTIGPNVSISNTTGSCLSINGGAAQIDGVTIEKAGLHGIDLWSVLPGTNLKNITINSSYSNGIKVSNSNVSIPSSVIVSGSKNTGIYLDNSQGQLDGVLLQGNNQALYASSGSKLYLRNCSFLSGNQGLICDGDSIIDAGTIFSYGGNEFAGISRYYASNGNTHMPFPLCQHS